jgi:Sigma-70 region 2
MADLTFPVPHFDRFGDAFKKKVRDAAAASLPKDGNVDCSSTLAGAIAIRAAKAWPAEKELDSDTLPVRTFIARQVSDGARVYLTYRFLINQVVEDSLNPLLPPDVLVRFKEGLWERLFRDRPEEESLWDAFVRARLDTEVQATQVAVDQVKPEVERLLAEFSQRSDLFPAFAQLIEEWIWGRILEAGDSWNATKRIALVRARECERFCGDARPVVRTALAERVQRPSDANYLARTAERVLEELWRRGTRDAAEIRRFSEMTATVANVLTLREDFLTAFGDLVTGPLRPEIRKAIGSLLRRVPDVTPEMVETEVSVRLLEHPVRLDPERAHTFVAWIRQIASHAAIDLLRQREPVPSRSEAQDDLVRHLAAPTSSSALRPDNRAPIEHLRRFAFSHPNAPHHAVCWWLDILGFRPKDIVASADDHLTALVDNVLKSSPDWVAVVQPLRDRMRLPVERVVAGKTRHLYAHLHGTVVGDTRLRDYLTPPSILEAERTKQDARLEKLIPEWSHTLDRSFRKAVIEQIFFPEVDPE